MVTKTYLKPTYLPTYVTVVTVVTLRTVVTVVKQPLFFYLKKLISTTTKTFHKKIIKLNFFHKIFFHKIEMGQNSQTQNLTKVKT